MNKPFTVKIADLQNDLVDRIEQAELPAVTVRHVLESILGGVRRLEEDQYRKDKEKWDAYCLEQSTENTEKEVIIDE